jgi:hypothetical protein
MITVAGCFGVVFVVFDFKVVAGFGLVVLLLLVLTDVGLEGLVDVGFGFGGTVLGCDGLVVVDGLDGDEALGLVLLV